MEHADHHVQSIMSIVSSRVQRHTLVDFPGSHRPDGGGWWLAPWISTEESSHNLTFMQLSCQIPACSWTVDPHGWVFVWKTGASPPTVQPAYQMRCASCAFWPPSDRANPPWRQGVLCTCVGRGQMTSTNEKPRMTECWSGGCQGIHPGGTHVCWQMITLI